MMIGEGKKRGLVEREVKSSGIENVMMKKLKKVEKI